MDIDAVTFLLFGASLVSVFAGIIIYYYSRKGKQRVEEPKYRMLEDE